MVEVIRVMRRPGIWEYFAECWLCEGTGNVSGERFVIDYDNGGYLVEADADCPDCSGDGYRDLTDEEYEAAVFDGRIPGCAN